MLCPTCFQTELQSDTRNVPYTYKGQKTELTNIQGDFCNHCGEMVLDEQQSQKLLNAMKTFEQAVNASYVDPTYIQYVRKKLQLDQRQASEIFGGGVNAFSRYETGKACPPIALIKLLKLLDNHPNLLAEIKG
ncbi:antitoxin [Pasteurellaceae bacterium 15-036681]|nr:antitoxin [Pasteurellaceae bacterium 15-036681]